MDFLIFFIGLVGLVVSIVLSIKRKIKREPKKKSGIIIGVCLVMMVVGLFMPSNESGNKDNDEKAKKQEEISKEDDGEERAIDTIKTDEPVIDEEPQTTTIGAGNYKVGEDIAAGEYVILTDGIMGYYELSKDSSGELDSIITNDNFTTFTYLTISDDQYLKLQMSYAIPVDEMEPYEAEWYGPGMYKVGHDIPAGEYNVQKEEGQMFGYVEVSKDSKGVIDSIITNDNFETNKYITVKDGQYLKIQFAYIE